MDKFKLKGDTVYKKSGRSGYCAQAVFFVPTGSYDADGFEVMERKEKSKLFKTKTKREATKLAREWVASLNEKEEQRRRGITSSTTVSEFMDDYLDALQEAGEREASTISRYRSRANYIKEGLAEVCVLDLDNIMIKAWMNKLKKRLSPQTVNDAFVLLRLALSEAVTNDQLKENVALKVKKLKTESKEANALNATERARLLADLDAKHAFKENPPAILATKIALFTGMRIGEICALRWKNVDFAHDLIKVREAIGRKGDSGAESYIKTPKTKAGRRDIPMPSYLKPLLEERRAQMKAACKEAHVPFSGDLFVLGDVDGAYMTPHAVSLSWRKRCIRLNLVGVNGERPTFHDLRHTFATYALNSGADIVSVSNILGHKQVSTTLDIYAADDADVNRLTMQKAEAALSASAPTAQIIQLRPTGTEN